MRLSEARAEELLHILMHPRGPRPMSYAIVAAHGRAFLEFEPLGLHETWAAREFCFANCMPVLETEAAA